jgi:hypothetical protein
MSSARAPAGTVASYPRRTASWVPQDQVERLFDPSRHPSERVRDDDWHPMADVDPVWRDLDAYQTVKTPRRWYLNLPRDRSHWDGGR